jgi:streptogramin lyase
MANLWFLDTNQFLDEYNPASGTFHQVSVPDRNVALQAIASVPGQAIFVTIDLAGSIDAVDPASLKVTSFAAPDGIHPDGIVLGPDGDLYLTTDSASIGQFNPSTNAFHIFPTAPNGKTIGITVGPDKNIWFTEWT